MDPTQDILLQLLSQIDPARLRAVLDTRSDITLQKFEDEYTTCCKATHTKNSLRQIKSSFSQLKEYSGDVQLNKIDVKLAENFISKTLLRSQSAASLYYRTLRPAFSKAVAWNYIHNNPFLKFKLPKIQRLKPAYITHNELELICSKETRVHLKNIYRFLFFTGLRASEALHLTWDCVNLPDKIIQIGNESFITKSKKIRYIPLPDSAVDIISNLFPKLIHSKKSYVFSKENGFPYTPDYISKQWKRCCRTAEMPDGIHLHSLRHSTASFLVQKGVPLYAVRDILGHSEEKTTQIYSHLDLTTLRNAMNNFNDVNRDKNLSLVK